LSLRATIIELVTLVAVVVAIFMLATIQIDRAELHDLRCRVARMETLAVSRDPLPNCEEE
jgi:hypothetical protein